MLEEALQLAYYQLGLLGGKANRNLMDEHETDTKHLVTTT